MERLGALRTENAHARLHDLDGQVLFEAAAAALVRAVGECREAGGRQRVQTDGTLDRLVLRDLERENGRRVTAASTDAGDHGDGPVPTPCAQYQREVRLSFKPREKARKRARALKDWDYAKNRVFVPFWHAKMPPTFNT